MKPKPEDLTEILQRLNLSFVAQNYEAFAQEAAHSVPTASSIGWR